MKKIYLLLVAALFVTFISAEAQRVIVQLPSNYEVDIDGRYYSNNETVNNISYGQHTVRLYEVRPGLLGIGKRRQLVSTSTFDLRNNDVSIEVDRNGQLRIYDSGYNNNQNGNWNNGNRNNNTGNGNNYQNGNGRGNGKGYGPYNNPDRGHKYGLYKKNKNDRRDWNDDDDDHDHDRRDNRDNRN
ncbi:MAG: hypothetical protein HYX40_02795 [Sphingobacteriales bacterium]|nr:hypothetical protein [Sphingobacteriales bacterium]